MKRTIRQVFGTTRPRDIWLNLFTFDQLLTRPIIHIVYWCGLGLLFIFALGWLGIMAGTGIKDASVMGWLLSFGLAVVGMLGFMIAVLAWRSLCEFYMAVMNIAEDLRYLRQFQEKLTPASFTASPSPVVTQPETAPAPDVAAVAEPAKSKDNIMEDPFFRPRFERKDL